MWCGWWYPHISNSDEFLVDDLFHSFIHSFVRILSVLPFWDLIVLQRPHVRYHCRMYHSVCMYVRVKSIALVTTWEEIHCGNNGCSAMSPTSNNEIAPLKPERDMASCQHKYRTVARPASTVGLLATNEQNSTESWRTSVHPVRTIPVAPIRSNLFAAAAAAVAAVGQKTASGWQTTNWRPLRCDAVNESLLYRLCLSIYRRRLSLGRLKPSETMQSGQ